MRTVEIQVPNGTLYVCHAWWRGMPGTPAKTFLATEPNEVLAMARRWDRGRWDVRAYAETEGGRETIYSSRREPEPAA